MQNDDRVKPVGTLIESVEAAKEELKIYCGTPKCCDCKWKLDSPIAQSCGCQPGGGDRALNNAAMARARELQDYVLEHAGTEEYYAAIS